jgi:hypothetical protein
VSVLRTFASEGHEKLKEIIMRTLLIIIVLCFCSSTAFTQGPLIKANNTAITTTLEANTANSGPIGAIINAINRADAWIQKNFW